MSRILQISMDQYNHVLKIVLALGNVQVPTKETTELVQAKLDNETSLFGTEAICHYILSETSYKPLLGKTEEDQLEIHEKIQTQSQKDLLLLNEELKTKTFSVKNYLTLADLFLYSQLYTSVSKMRSNERIEHVNVVRYFDLIQNWIRLNLGEKMPTRFVEIDLDAVVPIVEKKKEQAKEAAKQDKKEKNKKESKDQAKDKQSNDKPKKDDKKKQEPKVVVMSPSRIDLRVGYIKSVRRHPEADALYIEEIDVGEEKPRQVISGLVKYMKEEELTNQYVVLVCNLKPAKMRGIESQAMVLCASTPEKVEFIRPPAESKPGDKVYFEGYKGQPDAQLKSKEKVWETLQPRFVTSDKLEPTYIEDGKVSVLKTEVGVCKVDSLKGAPMK